MQLILPNRVAAIGSFNISEEKALLEIRCAAPAFASSFNYHSTTSFTFKNPYFYTSSCCEDIIRSEIHNLTPFMVNKLLEYI